MGDALLDDEELDENLQEVELMEVSLILLVFEAHISEGCEQVLASLVTKLRDAECHNDGLNLATLDDPLATHLERGDVRVYVGDEVEGRVRLEVHEHAHHVLQQGALGVSLTKEVDLATLIGSQISQEHERALNGAGVFRVDFVVFCSASLFGLLDFDDLGIGALVSVDLLHVDHEEVERLASCLELDALLDKDLVLDEIDQNLKHACFVCELQLRVDDQPEELLGQFLAYEHLSVFDGRCVAQDDFEGLGSRLLIVEVGNDLSHLSSDCVCLFHHK